MKNKYIVIDTWNGDGYSSENGTEIKTFSTKKQALKFAENRRNYHLKEFGYTPYKIDDNVFGYGEEEIGDYGSFQVYELKEDSFAIEILVNVNEVFILNKSEYEQRIKELNKEVFNVMFQSVTSKSKYGSTNIEDYIYISDNNENFYHSVMDYDYQFRFIDNK